jgi:peptidoglycan/xylan/chitin deacetylase (PgdA/CDA1 family)
MTRVVLAAALLSLPLLRTGLEPIPDKLVVLTFDDSKASHYTIVRPLLKKYGFGATFFITEGFTFRTNKQDYLTWEQIADLHREGFEIGNHTRDHLGASKASLPELKAQVEAINAQCAAHGIPRPTSFAYPGNAIEPAAISILEELGFRFARRGGAPEHPYEQGDGVAYEPGRDHPLLLPSAGDARPFWTLENLSAPRRRRRTARSRFCSSTERRMWSIPGFTRHQSDSRSTWSISTMKDSKRLRCGTWRPMWIGVRNRAIHGRLSTNESGYQRRARVKSRRLSTFAR